MKVKRTPDADDEMRKGSILTAIGYFSAGSVLLLLSAFLFLFETFHSAIGAKIFPPLLFLAGLFLSRGLKVIMGSS